MAIQREFYSTRLDGVKLYRTFSDAGKVIRQNETGEELDEAVDVETAEYTYMETDRDIEPHEEETKNAD